MKKSLNLKKILRTTPLILMMTTFGCSQQAAQSPVDNNLNGNFSSDNASAGGGTGEESPDTTPTIVDFFFDDLTEGIVPGQGLHGKIYYLLDRTQSEEIPEFLEDRFGRRWAFPEGITSADDIIDNGFEFDANILLTDVFVPTVAFEDGFKGRGGEPIKNVIGDPLFEGFALDVQGALQLGENMAPGRYEIAVLSDDGSMLTGDFDNNGSFETTIVDNDSPQSTRMGCSNLVLDMNADTKLPIRLKYFQGPRFHISLVILMRWVRSNELPGQDPLCGFSDNYEWFNFTEEAGYEPDLVNSKYGELTSRGWFRPTRGALTN